LQSLVLTMIGLMNSVVLKKDYMLEYQEEIINSSRVVDINFQTSKSKNELAEMIINAMDSYLEKEDEDFFINKLKKLMRQVKDLKFD
jgi:hypothetical protein